MFKEYLPEFTAAEYNKRILLLNSEEWNNVLPLIKDIYEKLGFETVIYEDDLSLRIKYEEKIKRSNEKLVIITKPDDYIPYDILKLFRAYTLSWNELFPKLNDDALKRHNDLDLDLLCLAYRDNYNDLTDYEQTEKFISNTVYGKANIQRYADIVLDEIHSKAGAIKHYSEWFEIARAKAKLDVLITEKHIDLNTGALNDLFKDWALSSFGKLSSEISRETPVLVSKAMEFMKDNSEKFVVIIMDGMSEFDWNVLSGSFADIRYERRSMFAMIPTTTSISRQCLLSNKYPSQLEEPWKQSREKAEFISCVRSFGFTENQIGYERGYNAEFGSFVKCGAVIINDVDDMVHSQQQGRVGMLNGMRVYAENGLLARTVKRFIEQGFDVYITADHGNTPCTGLGKLMGTGVETETKSRRMLVLQEFAQKDALIEKYGLIEYPKYYLDKAFDYLICDKGQSFDS